MAARSSPSIAVHPLLGWRPSLHTIPLAIWSLLQTQQSPFDGSEQALYDVAPDLHKALKKAIKRFTAEPA